MATISLSGDTAGADESLRYHFTLQTAAGIVAKAPRTPKSQRLLSWLHARIQGASGLLLHERGGYAGVEEVCA